MHKKVQQFIKTYQLFKNDEIQQVQLQHRFALVEAFSIQPGMRVLEIGCGQGDTTVVLADAVGAEGHVIAIDIAPGDYGAPFTLSQAHERIQASTLGARISFHVETDFLALELTEPVDVIVLSHCSWYFKSQEQLKCYFERMSKLNARVCVAEWDLRFTSISQRSHFCAVSILALYSTYIENEGNIQQVLNQEQLKKIAEDNQFALTHEAVIDARFLQDGAWEKDYANFVIPEFAPAPESIQSLVSTYRDVMNSVDDVESLNSFVLVFEREGNDE